MRRMVGKLLAQYGTEATLHRGQETMEIRCLFQAVGGSSRQSIEKVAAPLGQIPPGQFTCIGPGDREIMEGDHLEIGGRRYLVRRAEPYCYCGEAVYYRGVCTEEGGEDTWGI